MSARSGEGVIKGGGGGGGGGRGGRKRNGNGNEVKDNNEREVCIEGGVYTSGTAEESWM